MNSLTLFIRTALRRCQIYLILLLLVGIRAVKAAKAVMKMSVILGYDNKQRNQKEY